MTAVATPAITVLMATYNGRQWLPDQVASILGQEGVEVRLVVSDDGSDDGTWQWLQQLAAEDARVRLLPQQQRLGAAAANFYRLIAEHDTGDGSYVALSDQDDCWLPGKLAAQALLLASGYDGVSSDVVAFDESGNRHLLRKSLPQRRYDHLFESGGPGSTFLLSPRLVRLVQDELSRSNGAARSVAAHDWLIYALCRSNGWRWLIEQRSWVDYRQHAGNELGANKGLRSALWRFGKIRQGWHRQQVLTLTDLAIELDPRADLVQLRHALASRGYRGRLWLLKHGGQLRRHPRDRAILLALIATGLW